MVKAVPALKPLLGRKVELIALDLETQAEDQPEPEKISFDEFLATRPAWPADRPPVTLQETEQAISEGALRGAQTGWNHQPQLAWDVKGETQRTHSAT